MNTETNHTLTDKAKVAAEKLFENFFDMGEPTVEQIAQCEIGKAYFGSGYIAGYNASGATAMLEALKEIKAYHDRCAAKGEPVLSPHWENLVCNAIKSAQP